MGTVDRTWKTQEQATADAQERANLMRLPYVVFQDLWAYPWCPGFGCVSAQLFKDAGPFRTLVEVAVIQPG